MENPDWNAWIARAKAVKAELKLVERLEEIQWYHLEIYNSHHSTG